MKKKLGFTLIEMMVTIGVLGFIIPTVFAITFSILRQQTKVYALQEVKKQGDNALSSMKNLIRNEADSIHSAIPDDANIICNVASPSTTVNYFKDRFGNWFKFDVASDKIASQSSINNQSFDLTNSKVKVKDFSLTCEGKSSFTSPIVTISFEVEYITSQSRPQDTASLKYQSKIKLRN